MLRSACRYGLPMLLVLAGLCAPLRAQAEPSGNLVSAEWLRSNLGRADLLLLDAQPPALHRKAHIPGAVNVNVYSYGAREQTAEDMQGLMQSWGITDSRTVVVYDQGGNMLATRLFFDLYLHGFPVGRLRLLDGGIGHWQALGGTVTAEPTPSPARGDFRVPAQRPSVLARMPAVLAASGDPVGHALVDALEPEYYYGQTKFFDRAGHIPNAASLPYQEMYYANGTFKPADELRRLATYRGVRAEQQIITYCGGGIAATVPWFALNFVAGYPHVSVYQGSELDWLRDDRGLPFWTYAAPTLMRDAAWLNAWGGRMLRSFGLAPISVVDVRSTQAFGQGHVPAALSLPAERFVAAARDPQALTASLTQAGVRPGDEAVVVSSGGLNGDAALAFLLLEHAGQRKVSVLMESVDDWALRGLPLDKPAAPASASATAPPPQPAYAPVQPRAVLVGDAQAAHGAYPTVLLASGRSVPPSAAGTVHVPSADLLNADGMPKAAADIWTILAKAGLPRHATVICTADDPRDAAINYFILRLMGWPDVKVLVR